jgi:hypothetical protein
VNPDISPYNVFSITNPCLCQVMAPDSHFKPSISLYQWKTAPEERRVHIRNHILAMTSLTTIFTTSAHQFILYRLLPD